MFNRSLGIDIGSATAKVVVLNAGKNLLFSSYRRHNVETVYTLQEILAEAKENLGDVELDVLVTGSAGGTSFNFEQLFSLDKSTLVRLE
jgi:activator of 2-hydroxyglutaryl-CoA dehydratase